MDKIKRLILLNIPMSICNFRCSYCYLAQRDECYQGEQIKYRYSPEHVRKALSKERLGGLAYINICANGETLLTKDIDKYVYEFLKEGHYVEIITNLSVTPVLKKMLSWEKELLERLVFKCSFHYMQLKEKKILDKFADNVHSIWEAGASANIEVTPHDELIPYLDELKAFSMKNFGALPHITIARRDDTEDIDYLTNLPIEEYDKVWSSFDSDFWKFKKTIFKQKRKEFCYSGDWSLNINLASGRSRPCYCSPIFEQSVFENIDKPIKFRPIGKCQLAHCFNGHSLLTAGCIPNFTTYKYGDIRDRTTKDGKHWIQPKLKSFFNTTLCESNKEASKIEQSIIQLENISKNTAKNTAKKIKNKLRKIIKG